MRPNALVRTAVSATALVGIAVGSLAGASASSAMSQSEDVSVSTRTASASASVYAVNNLGLSTSQAKKVQCFLHDEHLYYGGIDGLLGTKSWTAMQEFLSGGYDVGPIDGIVGPRTIKALQAYLNDWGYNAGPEDGIAGSKTKAAFRRFANSIVC